MRALGWSALLFLLLTGAAWGAVDVYPVTEVQRGAVGVGYTVVEGTQIEPFSVEVLGVMERAGPAGSLILVRTSGNLIDRIGGIASGMSGSPVYIDGKLLGAIGYGFEFADHRIGLVTPAADMLAVMDLIQVETPPSVSVDASKEAGQPPGTGQADAVPAPSDTVGASRAEERSGLPQGIVLAGTSQEAKRLAQTLPPEVWVGSPVATPLVVSGLGPRAMGRLEKLFERYNVVPMQGGSPGGIDLGEVPLAPGASLGVQLVRGDVDVAAIGTVTAVDGDRFVAFGHPFLNRGEVDHFATGAYILHTVSSLSFPFKIGATTAPVGRLLQDRGAAIAGRLGDVPDTVSLNVRVKDLDRGVDQDFNVQVARDDELTVSLALVSALEALDRALDRLGAGTSRVFFQIDGKGMPRPLSRENFFYSGSDIAAASLSELWVGLDLLQENEFQDPVIDEILLEVEVEEERRTARIEKAEPSARRVRQGETVDVVVTLRPYRSPAFDVVIPLEIPEDTARGPVVVSVRGGIFGGYAPLPEPTDGLALPVGEEEGEGEAPLSIEAESLEKLIDEFEKEPRNNEVVVEFYPPSFFGGGRGMGRSEDSEEEEPGADDPAAESAAGDDGADHTPDSQDIEDGAVDADPAGDGEAETNTEHSENSAESANGPDAENETGNGGGAGDENEGEPDALMDDEASDDENGDARDYAPVRAVYATDYVVHGEAQFTLTITAARREQQDDGESATEEAPAAPAEPWPDAGVHPISVQ